MNVSICIPSHRDWRMDFGVSLVDLTHQATIRQHRGQRILWNFNYYAACDVATSRRILVSQALKSGADYILFLDDDMVFPRDTLHRLLAAEKPIVAANSVIRWNEHILMTARSQAVDGMRPVSSTNACGLERVDRVGTGVMLIEAEVFRKVPEPWFRFSGCTSDSDGESEDMYFCRVAKEHGYDIWIDHDLSREVGHIKEFVLKHQHVTWTGRLA